MIGVLDILMPIVAADMTRDELVLVVNAHPIRVSLERHALTGKLGRHRIVVGVERDTELLRGALALDATDVVGHRVEGLQQRLLVLEPIHGSLVRFTMETHIGDARQPHLGGRVHRTEVEEVRPFRKFFLT
jgi:hypothetical protein